MKFVFRESCRLNGNILYDEDELSFFTDSIIDWPERGLIINSVELGIAENGIIYTVGGYCPRASWIQKHLDISAVPAGEVEVIGANQIQPGIPYRLNETLWPVYFDIESNWICISSGRASTGGIEISIGARVFVDEFEQITQLWIPYHRVG